MNRKILLLAVLTTLGATASAQDVARVISSTAVTQQVGVPRQACATYATPGVPPQCSTQMIYESRTVGFNVVYEHAGKRYTVQLPQDPGPTVRLQAGASEVATSPAAGVAAAAATSPPAGMRVASVVPLANGAVDLSNDPGLPPDAAMVAQPYPPPVQVTYAYPGYAPGYVSYYGAPNFWGPVLSLGFVGGYYGHRHHFGGGWRGHGHGHGRGR